MRKYTLALTPRVVGIHRSAETPNVWGVLTETGYSAGVVTLVSLADGATSLYFGNGRGIVGGDRHLAIRKASRQLVSKSEYFLGSLAPTAVFPLPEIGRVRFYVLTFGGVCTADADETLLRKGQHELSPLFSSAQEVITQLRLQDEQGS
jgi:hypothetical protein